jgi:hypothetical protein
VVIYIVNRYKLNRGFSGDTEVLSNMETHFGISPTRRAGTKYGTSLQPIRFMETPAL